MSTPTPKDLCIGCGRKQGPTVPFAGAWACQDCRGRAKRQTRSAAPVAIPPAATAASGAPIVPTEPLRLDYQGYVLNAVNLPYRREGVTPELVRTLIHECGHIVVAFELGVPIAYVDPGPTGAYVRFDVAPTGLVSAKVTIAGYLAEHMVDLPAGAKARDLGGKDLDDLCWCAAELGIAPDRVARWVGELGGVVQPILVKHARGMDALGYRLTTSKWSKLDGPTVRAILRTGDPTVCV